MAACILPSNVGSWEVHLLDASEETGPFSVDAA
jgi:hypothetical protein